MYRIFLKHLTTAILVIGLCSCKSHIDKNKFQSTDNIEQNSDSSIAVTYIDETSENSSGIEDIDIAKLNEFIFNENPNAPYHLFIKNENASCRNYMLVDHNKEEIGLPEKLKSILSCPTVLSLKKHFLIYENNNSVCFYNIIQKKECILFTLYEDTDAISGPAWSTDGNRVMFVLLNENQNHNYKKKCRIICVKISAEGAVIEKKKYDRNVHYTCGSICESVPNQDFMFEGNDTIKYKIMNFENEGNSHYDYIVLPQ